MKKVILVLLLVVLVVITRTGGQRTCEDSHATCTQGDSLIGFFDVLANECAGIEPLPDSNDDLTVVTETTRICQEIGKKKDGSSYLW